MSRALILCLLLGVHHAHAAPSSATTRATKLLSMADDLAVALSDLDARARKLAAEQAEAKARLTALDISLTEVSEQVAVLDARLATQQIRLKTRLRARARLRSTASLEVTLRAATPIDVVRRQTYFRHVLAHDLRLLKAIRADGEALDRLHTHRAQAHARQTALTTALTARRAQLTEARATKAEVLRQVRGRQDLLTRAIRDQRRQRDRQGAPLAAHLKGAPPAMTTGFAAARGHLPRPVLGRVTRGFGVHQSAQHKTQTYAKGWEIKAPRHSVVYAIYGGRVAYSGWYRGFGNLVILDHGDRYFSLYAHLDTLPMPRGAKVRVGATIGTVGETGALKGPMLYFELRRGVTPLDPAIWLRRRAD